MRDEAGWRQEGLHQGRCTEGNGSSTGKRCEKKVAQAKGDRTRKNVPRGTVLPGFARLAAKTLTENSEKLPEANRHSAGKSRDRIKGKDIGDRKNSRPVAKSYKRNRGLSRFHSRIEGE